MCCKNTALEESHRTGGWGGAGLTDRVIAVKLEVSSTLRLQPVAVAVKNNMFENNFGGHSGRHLEDI